MSSRFTSDDYAAALRALLPRGKAWPDDQASTFARTLAGLAPVYAASDGAAVDLVADAFPIAPVGLLPEWEDSLGLPDPCAGASPTLEQRQAAVHARFIAGGGFGRQRYITFAAALGFAITISDYAPFRAGRGVAGQPLYDAAWAYAWLVMVHSDAHGLGTNVLKCELDAIKPAGTTILIDSSASTDTPADALFVGGYPVHLAAGGYLRLPGIS